jgi:AraC-like DNA-binding protein
VGQIKVALSDSLANQATIDELADGLDVSRSYVFQIFKMITGLSPYQYRLQVQLGRAKDLLLNSSLSIKQIAHSVRFNSVHQFSKTFRNQVGMTPGEYRHGGPCEKRAGRPPRDHTGRSDWKDRKPS